MGSKTTAKRDLGKGLDQVKVSHDGDYTHWRIEGYDVHVTVCWEGTHTSRLAVIKKDGQEVTRESGISAACVWIREQVGKQVGPARKERPMAEREAPEQLPEGWPYVDNQDGPYEPPTWYVSEYETHQDETAHPRGLSYAQRDAAIGRASRELDGIDLDELLSKAEVADEADKILRGDGGTILGIPFGPRQQRQG